MSPTGTSARNTAALFARASRNSERAIVPINDAAQAADAKLPAFFCVHSASGIAGTDFLDLAARFDPGIRFYGIQAPASQMADPQFGSSVEAIAKYYTETLLDFQPTGPILLGGYCIGAVIAIALAENLRACGRAVGLLLVIDGAPENVEVENISRWRPLFWRDFAANMRRWFSHGDLMRKRDLKSLLWSLSNNASAIGKAALGLKRGQRVGGGYAIEGVMDVSRYQPAHKLFINRLFGALFTYAPGGYAGEVIVYEATVKPLLYLPQFGRIWRKFVPHSEIVDIVGTHISMMHPPYVDALAADMYRRIAEYVAVTTVR